MDGFRHIKKNIDHDFVYDSNNMLQGCSLKRPDVYFELDKHCVIVEIDENQHRKYSDICECARINEIVNGIGGKSIILIRFNPDKIKNKGVVVNIPLTDKLLVLIGLIKHELAYNYDTFIIKLIQLYYDDNYDQYQYYKEEDITNIVCV